jgi:MFS family permease
MGSAVSLGLARFSYALLLSPMRADLGWSYFAAGSMNTANAVGYLAGALLAPVWLARFGARRVMLVSSVGVACLLAAHAMVMVTAALLVLRFLAGFASAATFIAGGLLAARLASHRVPVANGARHLAGLVVGIYYGGTGIGIVVSALLVPPIAGRSAQHAWQQAWLALGVAALVATTVTAALTIRLETPRDAQPRSQSFAKAPFAFALAGYFMFGLGYIGYMTFVVTLLRERRIEAAQVVAFFIVVGVGVIVSPWLWAGLLQRFRGGGPLAVLSALLSVATILPVLSAHPVSIFVSGALFGGVFLSLVASTTALVRHNLPVAAWPAGIAAFTVVFAAGQIVGPGLVGWVADGAGGLERGFVVSAVALALGALLAWRQKALAASAR